MSDVVVPRPLPRAVPPRGVRPADLRAAAPGAPSSPPGPPGAAVALAGLDLDAPLGEVLHRLVLLVLDHVPAAVGAQLVVTRDGRRVTGAAVVGAGAAVLDERLDDAAAGPCRHAAATGDDVLVATADEAVLGNFAAVAQRQGLCSAAGLVLRWGGVVVGALGVYAADPTALLGGPELGRARAVADLVATPVANAAALAAATTKVEQLHEAMRSRAVIEQAKGVLVARCGITPDEAFERLSRASQDSNVKLRVAAVHLVEDAARRARG